MMARHPFESLTPALISRIIIPNSYHALGLDHQNRIVKMRMTQLKR